MLCINRVKEREEEARKKFEPDSCGVFKKDGNFPSGFGVDCSKPTTFVIPLEI